MTRFFITPEQIAGDRAYLSGDDAKHCRVLRLRPGETVILCDGNGCDYVCEFESGSKDETQLIVTDKRRSVGEPIREYRVYCAFPKRDKAERVIQKAAELGASLIAFFPSEFCAARYTEADLQKKCSRWREIAKEAAQQSGRGKIPELKAFGSMASAIAEASTAELSLFCNERERSRTLKDAISKRPQYRTAAIVTGSEGGFSEDETQSIEAAGLISVTLGKRILRCETAPLAVLSVLTLIFDGGS